MELLELMKHRRAIRRFDARQVDEDALQKILEAGLYAPSAGGRQGVPFAVCQDREVNERLGKIKRAKDAVTAEDLEPLPLILPERLTMQSELANWFGPRFSRLTVACTGNLKTNSAVAVREGCGCALAVGGLSAFWDENKLAVRPLSPALYATVALAWKREQPLGRAAERFIQFVPCFLSIDKA